MEVFPLNRIEGFKWQGLLHVRGGVSKWHFRLTVVRVSSPRPWRCFYVALEDILNCRVFSTSVEVFQKVSAEPVGFDGLLHVRGGVSACTSSLDATGRSSPRPWRCFRHFNVGTCSLKVFSTSVEVFLRPALSPNGVVSLLHVRGGVSESDEIGKFSFRVFSTSVEVFLCLLNFIFLLSCLLHVRGGVSSCGNTRKGMPNSSPRPWRCFEMQY